ncbi:MAG: beta-lactamase family protein [Bacteroidia bacterium]|nr:beta-lactamase family protein [Bacteroidia bacterium]
MNATFTSVLLCLFLVAGTFLGPINAQEIDAPAFKLPEDKQIESWLEEMKIPAVGVIAIQKGRPIQATVLGEKRKGEKADFKTLFDVASLTKSFSTHLVLKLASNGNWDLEEPLYKYWVDPDVAADSRHKKLNSLHCLGHKSGFSNWRWMEEDKKLKFNFHPGEKVMYSGEGFEYLKKAVEKKTAKSFDHLMDSLIFTPLGLERSYLVWDDNKTPEGHVAHGTDKEGKWLEFRESRKVFASDNLLISLQDCGLFMNYVLEGADLEKDIYQKMISPVGEMKEGVGIGLGWVIFEDLPNGEYALFNAGSDPGVNAVMVILPRSQRALAIFTNGDNGRGLIMRILSESLDVGKSMLERL